MKSVWIEMEWFGLDKSLRGCSSLNHPRILLFYIKAEATETLVELIKFVKEKERIPFASEIFLHASCYWLQHIYSCHHHYFQISEDSLLELNFWRWFLTTDTSVSSLSLLQVPGSSQSHKLCSLFVPWRRKPGIRTQLFNIYSHY